MLNTVLLQDPKAVSFWMFLPRQEKNIKLPVPVLGRQQPEAILTLYKPAQQNYAGI